MKFVSAEYCRNAGLGNKLFPWARAKICSNLFSLKLVQPFWVSPRGAAVTRGGIDYSHVLSKIWLLNNFVPDNNAISYINYFFSYRKKNSLYMVDDLNMALDALSNQKDDNIHLRFRWNTAHNFSDLQPYQELIRRELNNITSEKELDFVKKYENYDFIALNVRTGNDFIDQNSSKNGYVKTNLSWFVKNAGIAREKYGDLPILVVSDGGIQQLKPLLQLPNTTLLFSKTAIADLLVVSKAKVLLGSGNSSFCAWASFLGGMDTYSASSTPFTHFHINYNNPKQAIKIL